MRILKLAIKAISTASLIALVVNRDLVSAVLLLVFASVSLGIMIGEKIDGGRKYER